MADGDDNTPIGNFTPLVAPGPSGDRPPPVVLPGDNTRVGTFKPLLSTSFEKVPSKDNGSGSVWGELERRLGLGTREVIEGISSLPTTALDLATWPGRAIQRAAGIPTTAPSDLVQKGLDATGLPTAQTDEEKRNAEAIRGGAAMLTPMSVALQAPGLVARLPAAVRPLVATPGTTSAPLAAGQVAQGAAGGVGGEMLANSDYVPDWLKPTARLAGNILGSGATTALAGGLGTLRNAATGVSNDISQALERLGITPRTMGSVSSSPGTQAMEGNIIRLPGAVSTLQPASQGMVDDFGRAVENTATQLHPSVDTAASAGTVVQQQLRNWRENVNPAEQAAVWNPLNQRMAGASVDAAPYRRALEYAASPPALASLPENQRAFASGQARRWLDALNADIGTGGTLTWEQAQALRTRIGDAMGTPDIVASIGNQQLRRIYGGLAEGMENTAAQHGQGAPFQRANQTTTDAHQFIDGTLSKGISAPNARQESIDPGRAATSMLEDNTAMQQLRDRVPEAADALGAYQLRAAAQAKPSQQGASDTTSTGTFLSTMRGQQLRRPEGQAALYSDPAVSGDLGDLLAVAAQLRGVERNINRSGTASSVQYGSFLPAVTTSLYYGGPKAAALTAAGYLGPRVLAHGLTSRPGIALAGAEPGARPAPGLLGALLANQANLASGQ